MGVGECGMWIADLGLGPIRGFLEPSGRGCVEPKVLHADDAAFAHLDASADGQLAGDDDPGTKLPHGR